ncbi:MAG: PH domain-containing protein [Planctomycetes bacterium]|nr:PH domain-containing protein [Planctomycetota bacterium]
MNAGQTADDVHGGVADPASGQEGGEATAMIVWPSIAVYACGRAIGRVLAIRWPDILFVRLGVLLAPPLVPIAAALYFMRLVPSLHRLWPGVLGLPVRGSFYRLTNRRVIEAINQVARVDGRARFTFGAELRSVGLDRFDSIEVAVRPGQAWYAAGDLIFRDGKTETFRLEGVSRPEAFRHACMKARRAYVGVQSIRRRELASAQ